MSRTSELVHLDARPRCPRCSPSAAVRRHERVDERHVGARGDERPRQVRADEPEPAGDQHPTPGERGREVPPRDRSRGLHAPVGGRAPTAGPEVVARAARGRRSRDPEPRAASERGPLLERLALAEPAAQSSVADDDQRVRLGEAVEEGGAGRRRKARTAPSRCSPASPTSADARASAPAAARSLPRGAPLAEHVRARRRARRRTRGPPSSAPATA